MLKSSKRPGVLARQVAAIGLASQALVAPAAVPEPAGWFAGDMHVHRNCGGSTVESVTSLYNTMVSSNLSVISLLADMGNAEVKNASTDLGLVNGQDASVSTAGRIVHWDTEWHWDATYSQYPHQALGGHLVALGLTNAYQIWSEYTFPILDWARQQGGIAGFAHFQYLDENIPQTLTCCTPIEYPVEVALGACDFISEDVNGGDAFIHAYYRLLNCGFRPGFAAGSDHPCGANVGSCVTFAQVAGGTLTYRGWLAGIAGGRTVVSRNGRNEFLALTVNGTATPGDEVQLTGGGSVTVTVQWTASQSLSGTIELVQNGQVVASKSTSAGPSTPGSLTATVDFTKSGWLCARRMGSGEHKAHTAAVFVLVDQAPVRTSVADAQFYVDWMDTLLANTSPGGVWSSYFVNSRAAAQARYSAARSVFQQIALEAAVPEPLGIETTFVPEGILNVPYTAALAASGGTTPYSWTVSGGGLPLGLTLNPASGVISGIPTGAAATNFTARVYDSANPVHTAARALSLTVLSGIGPGGVLGNTNNGSSTDVLWDGGAWINASRFQAASNFTVTTVRAKVVAVAGAYRCAVYAGSSSQPGLWLRQSVSVNAPASGWQDFPLASPLVLTNGQYYWLAIWSDDAAAKVYYSDTAGTLRWGQYDYGAWPDPLTTTGGGNLKYCIYALGPTVVPTLTALSVTPANSTLFTGATRQFTATGTYSDGSTQPLSSQLTWTSTNPAVATITSAGLASGVAAGTTTIGASLGAVSGGTLLTVQAPPTLVSLAVTPANPTIAVGATRQFTATGTYSDSTTSNLTSQVVWSSASPGVATINAAGLASGVAAGTAGIHATLGAVNGGTTLTVQVTPLTLLTTTLPTGVVNVAYSATLSASGGTPPYTWALASGALPSNLTLNPSSGLLSGTPTAAGSYNLAVRVSDAGSPAQAVTNPFTLGIAAPVVIKTLWPSTTVPGVVDGGPDSSVELGVKFRSDVAGTVTGVRFYKASANTGTHTGNLWTGTGTRLATATFTNETASGWQQVNFAPVAIASNTVYVVSYHAVGGHYSEDQNYFATKGVDNPPLHALTNGVSGGNGVYLYGTTSGFPNQTWRSANYWVDVVFTPNP